MYGEVYVKICHYLCPMRWLNRHRIFQCLLAVALAVICLAAGVYSATITPCYSGQYAETQDGGNDHNPAVITLTQLNYSLPPSSQTRQGEPTQALPILLSIPYHGYFDSIVKCNPYSKLCTNEARKIPFVQSIIPLGFFLRI